MMSKNSMLWGLFLDVFKFMLSVMALCFSSRYFLDLGYSYAIEGLPLLLAVKCNFAPLYLLWVIGIAIWLKIEEKGLAFATSLIILTGSYLGRRLGYLMPEDMVLMNAMALRITFVFAFVIFVLAYLRYRYREGDTRLFHYLILATCTIFLSCINDVAIIASWLPMIDFEHVKDFMTGVYVSWSSGLIYIFEVLIYDEDFYACCSD